MSTNLSKKKKKLIDLLQSLGIENQKILSIISEIPREDFIADYLRQQAYENAALPIESGQTISQPFIVAYMTQELKVDKKCKVLEIGTGSGYQSVVLAKLCKRLFTIERHLELYKTAEQMFKKQHLYNITTLFGNGMKGWEEQAPFDRIMVTAAGDEIPDQLLRQLKEGGIMVIPVGSQDETQHVI
ncbi:MAG: protein-L-isoaspartate(D-aspartate) O-methyltransferase, partial [Proteobacteria bacterium]|nr:protein-L-isoaspartate(D-aspartate) O-methyltransferase [Pseudomonadota bacterium]